ncbi:hypothetical protein L208DRAFT_1478567 [Tricholoma matsutake]|nr:hypothetical protein L208DRAFT_1478567 [Tricholoma matsutake 945]
MVATKTQLLLALLSFSAVNTQSTTASSPAPTSTAGISHTNLQCVCTSSAFQTAAVSCLSQNCTAADLTAALNLQQSECGALSGTSTGTSTAAGTSTTARPSNGANSTSASATTGSSPAATSSRSAAEQQQQVVLGIVGAVVMGVWGLVL